MENKILQFLANQFRDGFFWSKLINTRDITDPIVKAIKDKKQEILNSITCKLVHEGEIFIASNQTMWPCCFLWDSMFKNKESIVEKLNEYSEGWNSLRNHSIDEVLAHPWFDHILAESWNPSHAKHFVRCIRTCAYNKAYQNEINYVDKETTK